MQKGIELNQKFVLYSDCQHFRMREIEHWDLEFLMKLRNHPETQRFLGQTIQLTMEMQEKWFSSLHASKDKKYYIYEKLEAPSLDSKTWTALGMIRTHDIDMVNKHMGVGGDILLDYRGCGYGTKMYELIFKLAFKTMGLHRLWLSVIDYNTTARNLYKKMGFRETGVQRDAVFKDGEYNDYIYMDILENEYNSNK